MKYSFKALPYVREDNGALQATYVYTYDNAGNILSKSTYEFTAEGVTPTNPTETKAYQYSNSQWGDLLVQMGDDSATYDEIGNPVSFEFGLADIYINWNGRLVKSVSAGIGPISLVNVTFQYNSDGIRTKKGNTNYYLSGSTIVGEETNGNVTLYIYDANGSILGFKYHPNDAHESSWSTYWYEKNIFGDIVAVYDAFGNKQVSYVYDAWGNTTQIAAANAPTPVLNNPFRYRGYYYDSELYMYYLGSRYYYPAIGRFLSADESSYLGANGDLNSYNLFAYCSNNPVMYTDPSGNFLISALLAGAIIGFAIGAASSVFSQLAENNGDWNNVNEGKVFYDAAWGAVSGALAATGIGTIASIATGAAIGAASSIGNDLIFENGEVDWKKAGVNALIGGVSGSISGAGADCAKYGKHVTKFVDSKKILASTIKNNSKKYISRQTAAMNVHATQLYISGARYLLGNTVNIFAQHLPFLGG